MTKNEVVNLYVALNSVGNLRGVKFAYGVAKNLKLVTPEIESLDKAREATPEFLEYEKKRIELGKEHAERDEKGKPKTTKDEKSQEIFVMADSDKWETAWGKLKEEYKEAIEAREKQIEEYNELLKTESTVELYKVKLEDVPTEITTKQLNGIFAIVEE